jgi:ribulose-5-phosphate 4-epimerase/fuculose-1-phosphate aldolase
MMSQSSELNLLQRVTRDNFATFCRILYERELVTGVGGNVAARFGNGFLITPSGFSLRDITPASLLHVHEDGTVEGEGKPSKEMTMHHRIFMRRPEVNVVCHVHGSSIIAVSTLFQPGPQSIPPVTSGFVFFAHPLPMIPFFLPGSNELAGGVEEAFAGTSLKALLLKNHGLITVGKTLAEALNIAEEVDEAARIYLLTEGRCSLLPTESLQKIRSPS